MPIFEIEERVVPQGGVFGEHLSATQPFPVAPPPLVRQSAVTEDDAWGMLYFDTKACRDEIKGYKSEGVFTPPSLEGTILLPGYGGGINWGGIAFDPVNQIAVVNPNDLPMVVQLIHRKDFDTVRRSERYPDSQFTPMSGTPYGMRRQTLLSSLDVPCIEPPWGVLVAVDMVKGEILWKVPFGTLEDIAPAFFPNFEWGVPSAGGPIITSSGLIFIAAAMDDYLRAFDIKSGKELWQGRLPAGGQATPMTYYLEKTGKQYVVITAGGHPGMGTTNGDYVIGYALKK